LRRQAVQTRAFQPGKLTNDFFVNLLDMRTEWHPAASDGIYEAHERKTNNWLRVLV
jgi:catalase (peroxidase I)